MVFKKNKNIEKIEPLQMNLKQEGQNIREGSQYESVQFYVFSN